MGAEEIEIAPECATRRSGNFHVLDSGITHLQPGAIFVVLYDGIVEPQFVQRRKNIIGAEAFVNQIAGEADLPVVSQIINERRFRKHPFQPQLIAEQPDQTAARSNDRILIKRAANPDDAKNLVFLQREGDEKFPRYVKGIAGDSIFEINPRIEFEASAGVVFDHVFEREMPIQGLEMIGKAIFGSAKIVTLVFEPGAEIPFSGNEKSVVIAEIVIIRIALAESRFVFEIAAEGINRIVGKDIMGIFVLRLRGLLYFRFGSREYPGTGKNRK